MSDITTIHMLPVAVPPMLEAAIGYEGDARLVAFFFDAGDEAYYSDGHTTTCGEWDAYELYVNHPLVAPHVRGYDLGSSEESPTHYLLLDREARTLSVAPVAEAQRLLREQWGAAAQPESVLAFSEQEWEQFLQDLIVPISQLRSAHWREHRRLVEQLTAWLAERWEGA